MYGMCCINIPMKGVESEVFGTFSATSSKKTVKERSMVTPSEIFSPASTGTRNTKGMMSASISDGKIRCMM